MKVNNKKGFTLAELLIVVAIIGVLIAIAMPTFGGQLEKARKATDEANCRAAYGQAVAEYLTADDPASYSNASLVVGATTYSASVSGGTVTVVAAASTSNGLQSSHYQTAGIKCVGGVVGDNS